MSLGVVLTRRLADEQLSAEGEQFARELVTGVWQHRAELDLLIHQHAPEWPVDQMAVVDRNVLRIAIYEFNLAHITPLESRHQRSDRNCQVVRLRQRTAFCQRRAGGAGRG